MQSQYEADVAALNDAELSHREASKRWLQRADDYDAIASTVDEAVEAGRGLSVRADFARQLAATARAYAEVHQAQYQCAVATRLVGSLQRFEVAEPSDRLLRWQAKQRRGRRAAADTSAVPGPSHDDQLAVDALEAATDTSDLADAFAETEEDGNP